MFAGGTPAGVTTTPAAVLSPPTLSSSGGDVERPPWNHFLCFDVFGGNRGAMSRLPLFTPFQVRSNEEKCATLPLRVVNDKVVHHRVDLVISHDPPPGRSDAPPSRASVPSGSASGHGPDVRGDSPDAGVDSTSPAQTVVIGMYESARAREAALHIHRRVRMRRRQLRSSKSPTGSASGGVGSTTRHSAVPGSGSGSGSGSRLAACSASATAASAAGRGRPSPREVDTDPKDHNDTPISSRSAGTSSLLESKKPEASDLGSGALLPRSQAAPKSADQGGARRSATPPRMQSAEPASGAGGKGGAVPWPMDRHDEGEDSEDCSSSDDDDASGQSFASTLLHTSLTEFSPPEWVREVPLYTSPRKTIIQIEWNTDSQTAVVGVSRVQLPHLCDPESLARFPPTAVFAVSLPPWHSVSLVAPPDDKAGSVVIDPSMFQFKPYSGELRFHPSFKPPDVAFTPTTASCMTGPRTVALWGLPAFQIHKFELEIVGSMTTVGMVAPSPKLLNSDVKKHSKFVAGGSGSEKSYGSPEWFADVSGVLRVTLDLRVNVLTLRPSGRTRPIVISGFPPGHIFAVTLYSSAVLSIVRRLVDGP